MCEEICQPGRCSFLLGKIRGISNSTTQSKKIDKESSYGPCLVRLALTSSVGLALSIILLLLCSKLMKVAEVGRQLLILL